MRSNVLLRFVVLIQNIQSGGSITNNDFLLSADSCLRNAQKSRLKSILSNNYKASIKFNTI